MLEYLPTNDLIFKKMLTSEDSANILRNFVKDLLDIEFKTLTPKETYHIDSYKKSYEHLEIGLTEVDILAVAEDGSQATIECQIQPHQFFQERTVFYLREAFRAPFGNRESEDFVVKNNFSALISTCLIRIKTPCKHTAYSTRRHSALLLEAKAKNC